MSVPFLLDTTVLLQWTRGKSQATALDQQFNLLASALRPLMCEVSLGEMWAFSRNPQWSDRQRQRLLQIEQHVTAIDISDRRVIDAYADLSTLMPIYRRSRKNRGGRFSTGKMICGSAPQPKSPRRTC